jgi:hypothetical protein
MNGTSFVVSKSSATEAQNRQITRALTTIRWHKDGRSALLSLLQSILPANHKDDSSLLLVKLFFGLSQHHVAQLHNGAFRNVSIGENGTFQLNLCL